MKCQLQHHSTLGAKTGSPSDLSLNWQKACTGLTWDYVTLSILNAWQRCLVFPVRPGNICRAHKAAKTEPNILCWTTRERKSRKNTKIHTVQQLCSAPPQAAAWSYIYDHRAWPKEKIAHKIYKQTVLMAVFGHS